MIELITLFIHSFWSVLKEMAPYLIFGYLIAGILSVFVTTETVQRHLGGNKFAATLKAALFGMPLPLCSCSVIPVTASLRKSGAGRGAIASFLISTPTTGVDSILAAWALIGPIFAVYRAIMSIVLGVATGVLVNLFGEKDTEDKINSLQELGEKTESCCSHDHGNEQTKEKKNNKVTKALKYGFITIPKDLGLALFVGIVIASIISALIKANFINQFLGDGIGTMLIMLVVGIPLYVCATASIPLALGFMALGASPGAAFVFLIAGPATNAATITVLWKMIGKRSTVIMLSCMFFGALFGGLLLDAVWDGIGSGVINTEPHSGSHGSVWFYNISAVAFVAIQLWSMYGAWFVAKLTGGNVVHDESCCSSEDSTADTSCSSPKEEVATSSCCGSTNEKVVTASCCGASECTDKSDDCSGHDADDGKDSACGCSK